MYILVVRRYTIKQLNEYMNKIISKNDRAMKERKQVGVIENNGRVGLLWTEWQDGLGKRQMQIR